MDGETALRMTALERAANDRFPDDDIPQVIARADAYLRFLTGADQATETVKVGNDRPPE